MKQKIILEIDGVRHKLIETKADNPCAKCSVYNECRGENHIDFMPCTFDNTRYRKCKPGE